MLEMRVITFYIGLFFLLLSGGAANCSNMNAPMASKHFHKNHKSTLNHKFHFDNLSTNLDFDIEDDFLGNHDAKIIGKDKFLPLTYNLNSSSYFSRTNALVLNHFSKRFNIFPPLSGTSTPIYIALQVLRI